MNSWKKNEILMIIFFFQRRLKYILISIRINSKWEKYINSDYLLSLIIRKTLFQKTIPQCFCFVCFFSCFMVLFAVPSKNCLSKSPFTEAGDTRNLFKSWYIQIYEIQIVYFKSVYSLKVAVELFFVNTKHIQNIK